MNITLRTGPAPSLNLEELVIAQAFLGALLERIHENGHDAPDNLSAELKAVDRELTERSRADKERRLASLKLRHEGLLTQAEKRKNVEAEIAALQKELGTSAGKSKTAKP